MEFEKYFVDEFNQLLKAVKSDYEWSFYVEILIHLCFFNDQCPNKYFKTVLTNPKYLRGFFLYDEICNVDEEIKKIKDFSKDILKAYIKDYQHIEELKQFSQEDAYNFKKQITNRDNHIDNTRLDKTIQNLQRLDIR